MQVAESMAKELQFLFFITTKESIRFLPTVKFVMVHQLFFFNCYR